jgi:two-component system, cell cycle sensor histidine kinase and response regulator CckA
MTTGERRSDAATSSESVLALMDGFLRVLVESLVDVIVFVDSGGVIRYASPSVERALGYSQAEIVGRHIGELIPDPVGEGASSAAGPALGGRPVQSQVRHRNGGWRFMDTTVHPVEIPAVTGQAIHLHDVTERVHAAEALARDQGLLDSLIATIPDNIYFKDRDSRFIKINNGMARWFGLADPGGAVGKTDSDFFGPEHADRAFVDEQGVMASGSPIVGLEEKETWPDGRITWVSTTKVPIRDAAGRVVGLVGISRDITERRRLEEQLRQAQKMEAIGRLSGGIAHDFNNLLGVIFGYGSLLSKSLPKGTVPHRNVELILGAAERAAALTRQLLAFSRHQVLEPKKADLGALVRGLEDMLRRLIGEDVELVVHGAPDLWPVVVDSGQLEQVVMNLVVNARDATPSGGRILVETRNVRADSEEHGLGPHVTLVVSDTGEGMSPETQARLFEPFFTTKAPGKGTGLGLATTYGIVQQSGGRIEVRSEVGRGSTFTVHFPRTTETALVGSAPTGPVGERPGGGGETILLVEDEEALGLVISDVLEAAGYTVIPTTSPIDALARIEADPQAADLVLSDVVMPGLSGPQLVARLRCVRPDLRFLFMSGYPDEALNLAGDVVRWIQKPFSTDVLMREVRAALDESSPLSMCSRVSGQPPLPAS